MGNINTHRQHACTPLDVIEKEIQLFCNIVNNLYPEIIFWEAEKKDLFCTLFFKKSFLETKIEMFSKNALTHYAFSLDRGDIKHAKAELEKILQSNKHIDTIFNKMPSIENHTATTKMAARLNKLILKIGNARKINTNRIFEQNEIPLHSSNNKNHSFKCYRSEFSENEFIQLAVLFDDAGNETAIKITDAIIQKFEESKYNFAELDNQTAFQLNHDGFTLEAFNQNTTKLIHAKSLKSHKELLETINELKEENIKIRAHNKYESEKSIHLHANAIPKERMAKKFKLLNNNSKLRFAIFDAIGEELLFIHSDFLSAQLPLNKIGVMVNKNEQSTHLQLTSTENVHIHSSWHLERDDFDEVKQYFLNLNFPLHPINPL